MVQYNCAWAWPMSRSRWCFRSAVTRSLSSRVLSTSSRKTTVGDPMQSPTAQTIGWSLRRWLSTGDDVFFGPFTIRIEILGLFDDGTVPTSFMIHEVVRFFWTPGSWVVDIERL